jgi:hypothetical protein
MVSSVRFLTQKTGNTRRCNSRVRLDAKVLAADHGALGPRPEQACATKQKRVAPPKTGALV